MYYLLLAILYPISLLPFWVLYGISDLLYFILFRVIGYRKDVVMDNLRQSFPKKNEEELELIMKKYFSNLCDSIVETIKLLSISKKELNKRISTDWDVLVQSQQGEQVVQAYMSHQFNWEWATVVGNYNMPKTFTGMYLPISNKAFDRLMLKIRRRSGSQVVTVQHMMKNLASMQKEDIMWGFIADQNPSDPKRCLWVDFFNRKTAFAKGAEFVARRYNNKVYFGEIIKLKRGYYDLKLKLAFDNPSETKDGEITAAYVEFLEASIKRQPENWVWSHRRWKHIFKK